MRNVFLAAIAGIMLLFGTGIADAQVVVQTGPRRVRVVLVPEAQKDVKVTVYGRTFWTPVRGFVRGRYILVPQPAAPAAPATPTPAAPEAPQATK